jgi:hypothetical protein
VENAIVGARSRGLRTSLIVTDPLAPNLAIIKAFREMAEQLFSSDSDVLPDGDAISPVATGCMGMIALKVGCLLLFVAILGFAVVLGRFID